MTFRICKAHPQGKALALLLSELPFKKGSHLRGKLAVEGDGGAGEGGGSVGVGGACTRRVNKAL